MKQAARVSAAAVVALLGTGAGAASAAAFSISGGAYTAVAASNHTATAGEAYAVDCVTPTFAGVATGSATTTFTPSYGDCTIFGFDVDVAVSGPWSMTIVDGPNASGEYVARIDAPVGSDVTLTAPITACTSLIAGPQTFVTGVNGTLVNVLNVAGGVEVSAQISGIGYTGSGGCPFVSGTDGAYHTNGGVTVPGVTVS